MPVQNRIKILKCSSFEEVENKVNDFLAFDEHIGQLVGIDYRLEFNVVIIEYNVVMNGNNNNNKIIMGWGDYSYNSSGNNSPLTKWWKLYFPFLPDPVTFDKSPY